MYSTKTSKYPIPLAAWEGTVYSSLPPKTRTNKEGLFTRGYELPVLLLYRDLYAPLRNTSRSLFRGLSLFGAHSLSLLTVLVWILVVF